MGTAAQLCRFLAVYGLAVLAIGEYQVRLVPGPTQGRLEVNNGKVWGTVCYEGDFNNQAASVICNILNKPSKNAYWTTGDKFGAGQLNPLLSSIACNGTESSLMNCVTKWRDYSKPCSNIKNVVGIVCTSSKLPALFGYYGSWYENSTLNLFDKNHLSCSVTNSSAVMGFVCDMEGVGIHISKPCPTAVYFQRSQQGNISCTISNWQYPDQNSAWQNVYVMYPPLPFTMKHVRVVEGSFLNISVSNTDCRPPPTVLQWRKAGTNLIRNQNLPYRIYDKIVRTDAGEFLINISNKMESTADKTVYGNGLELLFIDVLHKPFFTCDDVLNVEPGSNVTISCSISANPLPHVYIWTDAHGEAVAQVSEPRLALTDVQQASSGVYKCAAVNKMDDDFGSSESGIGIAEAEVRLKGAVISPNSDSPSTTTNPQLCKDDTSTLTSNVLIAVLVITLIVIVMLVVVIVIMKARLAKKG